MILGVDVGGTFTDAALLTGDAARHRQGADHAGRPVRGRDGRRRRGARRAPAPQPADVERFVHGMTVATNALLEGRVARTALLATEGFTDLEELGRQARPELYRLCAAPPAAARPGRAARAGARSAPGPTACCASSTRTRCARRLDGARAARRPRSACSGASGTPGTSGGSAELAEAALGPGSTSRPRTRPPACSASTSAARRRSSTPPCPRCCAATSSASPSAPAPPACPSRR